MSLEFFERMNHLNFLTIKLFTIKRLNEESMANQSIISEFWEFLRVRKKYWLLPIVVVLSLFGALIVFTESSAVAPFIYALF